MKSKSVTTPKISSEVKTKKKVNSNPPIEKNKKEAPAKEASDKNLTDYQKQVKTKEVIVNIDHVYQVGEKFFPSVTTILNSLAKGIGFDMWMHKVSKEEAKDILEEAGLSGSKVHHAIAEMMGGKVIIPEEFVYVDKDGVEHKGLSLEEKYKLAAFVRWIYEFRPKVLAYEKIVYSESREFAGTADFIGSIKAGKLYEQKVITVKPIDPEEEVMMIIDWKTGSGIYDSYWLQCSAYAMAETEMTDKRINMLGILKLGSTSKKGYKFEVKENSLPVLKAFLGIFDAWKFQNPKFGPKVIDVPVSFKLPKLEQVKLESIKKMKGKQEDANRRIEPNPEAAKTGDDPVGDEKREESTDSVGLLPLPDGGSGEIRREAEVA